jgi:hypothetical protein
MAIKTNGLLSYRIENIPIDLHVEEVPVEN